MITGRQIRHARKLLNLTVVHLSSLADLPVDIVIRAETVDGIPAITLAQGRKLETTLRDLGAVFDWTGAMTLDPSKPPQKPRP